MKSHDILILFTVEEAGGKAFPCILDVRDEQQIKAVVNSAVQKVKSYSHLYCMAIETSL